MRTPGLELVPYQRRVLAEPILSLALWPSATEIPLKLCVTLGSIIGTQFVAASLSQHARLKCSHPKMLRFHNFVFHHAKVLC